MKPSLILIRGLPGSGKSTLAKHLAYLFELRHIEADEFFVDNSGHYCFEPSLIKTAHQWCQYNVLENLKLGKGVVVSNTFTQKWELEPYFIFASQFGLTPIIYHCQNDFGNVHGVPEEKIKQMKARFEHNLDSLFEEYRNKIAC